MTVTRIVNTDSKHIHNKNNNKNTKNKYDDSNKPPTKQGAIVRIPLQGDMRAPMYSYVPRDPDRFGALQADLSSPGQARALPV